MSPSETAHEIIENSPSIALRISDPLADWKVNYITKNVSVFGVSHEDILSEKVSVKDMIHPKDYVNLLKLIRQNMILRTSGFEQTFRISFNMKTTWVRSWFSIVRNNQGTPTYLDCVIRDYTKTKIAQEKSKYYMRQQNAFFDVLDILQTQDPAQALQHILEYSGKYLGVSSCTLFRLVGSGKDALAVHEWHAKNIVPHLQTGVLFDFKGTLPKAYSKVQKNNMSIMFRNYVRGTAKDFFIRHGIWSSAIFPVFQSQKLYGFLIVSECDFKRKWDRSSLDFLKHIAQFISVALTQQLYRDAFVSSHVSVEEMFYNMPCSVFVTDPYDNTIMFTNQRHIKESIPSNIYQEIMEYYTKHRTAFSDGKHRIFELHSPSDNRWFKVQFSTIPWTAQQKKNLFICWDISSQKKHEEYKLRLEYLDALTGLPNRYRCDFVLDQLLKQSKASGQFGYIICIDMDDFKILNEGYGHDYGDAMLIEYSNYLHSTFSECEVFRIGGDEFILLVDAEQSDQISSIIDNLLNRTKLPWKIMDKEFYCTVSIGGMHFPDGDMSSKRLINNAEIAMFEAKRAGKNNCTFYSSDLDCDSLERVELESMMRSAIAKDFAGFQLYYQPYVNIQDNSIIGSEALLRWVTPDQQFLPPSTFISLAEYLGLIVELGDFVLREAARMLKLINESGKPNFSVSVNVSMRQLQQPDILRRITTILDETKINPQNLILEVTENLAATDSDRVLLICNELREKGIRIAMDDFGTGYSSLSNIRDMPFDIIKIDRSFISRVSEDTYSHSFIRLITDLGHTLGKQICIEGVESLEQLNYCKNTKANSIQGFYFYKPMPSQEFLKSVGL